jgi:Na+-translocating ferredoxin:NAD+ oxidoreductase RnfG subunit
MKQIIAQIFVAIFVVILLYAPLHTSFDVSQVFVKKNTQRIISEKDAVLQQVLVSSSLNLSFFPPGVYLYQAGGVADAWFGEGEESLDEIYKKTKIPLTGGPAIKFMIRENGKFDFTTRGIIRSGVTNEEKTLISARICTRINENPRVTIFSPDEDLRSITVYIFHALRSAVKFREEKIAMVEEAAALPFFMEENEGQWQARRGETTLFLTQNMGQWKIQGVKSNDADQKTTLAKELQPGQLVRVVSVKRAMVNDSVVGTVIEWQISGFYEGNAVFVGIDNKERVTGVAVVRQGILHTVDSQLYADDSNFLGQFEGLLIKDLGLKRKDQAGLIDGWSGATISSKNLVAGVRACLQFNKSLNIEEYEQDE